MSKKRKKSQAAKKRIVSENEAGSPVSVSPQAREAIDGEPDARAIPDTVPVLPVINNVLFPGTVVPLGVGRERALQMLDSVLPEQKMLLAVAQRSPETEDPRPEDLYQVGTAVMVLKLLRVEEGQRNLIVHGAKRVRVTEWVSAEPYLQARVEPIEDVEESGTETEALLMNVRQLASRAFSLTPGTPDEAEVVLRSIDEPGALADFLTSNFAWEVPVKQDVLEEANVRARLRRVAEQLQQHLEVLEMSHKIQSQVKANIDESQRKYYLQEQLKAIQKELGQADERSEEIDEVRRKIEQSDMPEEVAAEASREADRLEKIPTASPEYMVLRTYLDVMTELPWKTASEEKLDVAEARKVLDADHHDLQKVKRRILEYLAVRKLAPESRGPILCFLGPPGVGKTSLGQSIARALGRPFIRMSLGGMRDEAELRGHRRTYIGAMPGRIVQELRKAGANNPVFMLDEVDKVGQDFRGDPTSALLEILDPAQNSTFQDNYLNVPFDLSNVIFIATANYMGPVPAPLRDRMEVIDLPGYTNRDKLKIATDYLVPRQRQQNGLGEKQIAFKPRAIETIIDSYTRESGVRELERQIGTICRYVAALVAEGKARSRTVNRKLVGEALGPEKYQSEVAQRSGVAGVATGLAYTPAGGEIIFVEAAGYPGKGNLTLTGQIGDVMRESAQAAMSLVKSRCDGELIDCRKLAETDVHVHVPAGAVPKDGPSAGVAMFTALTSFFTGRPVRADLAMTGEITLRGLVLPIGGVKEKVLAARRAGIRTVMLPKRNEKDLVDVPEDVRSELDIRLAETVDDVIDAALEASADNGGSSKARGRK